MSFGEHPITVAIIGDTGDIFTKIDQVRTALDELTLEARVRRTEIIQMVREGFTMISQLMSSFRQAMTVFGQSVDPFFSALIGSVLALSSMLISSAAVLSSTIIFAPLGAVIFGLAVSFNILTITKLLGDKAATMTFFNEIKQDMRELRQGRQSGLGGF